MNSGASSSFLLTCLLLIVLPALFTVVLGGFIVDSLNDINKSASVRSLRTEAHSFAGDIEPGSFFLEKLLLLDQKLEETNFSDPDAAFRNVMGPLADKVQFYVYNKSGQMLESSYSRDDFTKLFEYFWLYVHRKTIPSVYSDIRNYIIRYMGNNFHPRNVLYSNRQNVESIYNGKKGLIFHSRNENDLRGFFVFIKNFPEIFEILYELSGIEMSSDSIFIATDHYETVFNGIDKDSAKKILNVSTASKSNIFLHDGYLWQKIKLENCFLLFGKSFDTNYYTAYVYYTYLIVALLVIVAIVFAINSFLGTKTVWISIRLKLVALFIFAVYMPVLSLAYIAVNSVEDRRVVLENNAQRVVSDVVSSIDSGFEAYEQVILETFDKFHSNVDWHQHFVSGKAYEMDEIRHYKRIGHTGERFFNWLEIRDWELRQLFTSRRDRETDGIQHIARGMGLISLERLLPAELAKSDISIRPADLVIKDILESRVLGFSYFYEIPGQLFKMGLEGNNFYWYWNYFPDTSYDVAYLLGNTRIEFNAANYLTNELKSRFTDENVNLRVMAFFPENNYWIAQPDNMSNCLKSIFSYSRLVEAAIVSTVKIEGEDYIGICIPGRLLHGGYVAAFYPVSVIDSEISAMRRSIFIGVIIIFIVATLTGLLMTGTILIPVKQLGLGLNALHERHTEYRVNIESTDEFGELGLAFNKMIESVKEMLLAATVQKCLIPERDKLPVTDNYQVALYNKMATDVGGDYADSVMLESEQKLFVCLGDVTGHGVSSSLLTAMVKAMVFRAVKKELELDQMLKSISLMVFDMMKRQKLMTFCSAVVDLKTDTLYIGNAGHPFPFICNNDGQMQSIEHTSLPLGVSKKRSSYQIHKQPINKDDVLFIYSDGIIEAENSLKEPFGFDRLCNTIKENRHKSAFDIEKAVINSFNDFYDVEHLDDDITFVILKRIS